MLNFEIKIPAEEVLRRNQRKFGTDASPLPRVGDETLL